RNQVLDGADLPFDVGDRGRRPRTVRDDAVQLEPVRDTAVETVPEVGDRVVVGAQRLARDFELKVELAQQEVVRGHVADEGDEHLRGFTSTAGRAGPRASASAPPASRSRRSLPNKSSSQESWKP